ncbi:hypothetical protein CR194_09925 [Salipaludibacillus keqinensis]|uniref:Uncharacterized protein n=1 Tax=Salipaludibacillus keqinensis TaxID=2045207 RepID=A0A323TEZ8_9BACI|nr:hypothetical protein [Salipaludibacillus keqinensis]PYZ93479.1 hypothetical protein CR194_09925 [Salipaludibacillus keqinensis]
MKTEKRESNFSEIQLQQQMLHYKAETIKLTRQIQRMEMHYEVKKMKELLSSNKELIEKNTRIEKYNKELKQKKIKLEAVLTKVESRSAQLERTLKEVEKVKNKLTEEKIQWEEDEKKYMQEINSLTEKLKSFSKKTIEYEVADASMDNMIEKKERHEINDEPDQKLVQDDYRKNNHERFFQTFQALNRDNKDDEA